MGVQELLVQLNNSRIQTQNNPLYQTIKGLIDALVAVSTSNATTIVTPSNSAPKTATYLTAVDESAVLPNSRELIAGTAVSFDDTTPNERTINVTAGGGINVTVPGGGNITDTTAYGSEPGSPSTGDLDFYNDSPVIARFDGSNWPGWGPIFPLTRPVLGDFSWINQGGATVQQTYWPIYLSAPLTAGTSLRVQEKSISNTTTGVMTLGILPLIVNDGAGGAGLILQESGTGKILFFRYRPNPNAGLSLVISDGAGPTSLSNARLNAQVSYLGGPCPYLRVTISGTDYVFSVSVDGINYFDVLTLAKTTPFTTAADKWGFAVDAESSTFGIAASIIHVAES